LILLKELLVRRGDLRVVLMSATLDVSTFTSYLWQSSVLQVPSGPRFPVEEVYLDDLIYDPHWQQAQQEMHALMVQSEVSLEHQAAPAQGQGFTVIAGLPAWQGGCGALNPAAMEFVPGRGIWEPSASPSMASPMPQGSQQDDEEEPEEDELRAVLQTPMRMVAKMRTTMTTMTMTMTTMTMTMMTMMMMRRMRPRRRMSRRLHGVKSMSIWSFTGWHKYCCKKRRRPDAFSGRNKRS